jgi:hypothetical protein
LGGHGIQDAALWADNNNVFAVGRGGLGGVDVGWGHSEVVVQAGELGAEGLVLREEAGIAAGSAEGVEGGQLVHPADGDMVSNYMENWNIFDIAIEV